MPMLSSKSIKLLSEVDIRKIAAGEVVQRPYNVVKELVENSIDSNATKIEIELLSGGNDLILVKDNGCGINKTDLSLSVARHATSKISSFNDLSSLSTMGFRGEALSSICAVSKMTIISRTHDSDYGFKFDVSQSTFDADQVVEAKLIKQNSDPGTAVSCQQLFYNTPSRRKYLKSPRAEFSAISELIQAQSIVYPNITWVLKSAGKVVYFCESMADRAFTELAPDKVLDILKTHSNRVFKISNSSSQNKLLSFHNANDYLEIIGIMTPPGLDFATSKRILVFVNNRVIKDKKINGYIYRGYFSHLLKGRFPGCVLLIKSDPSLFDINIHPNKKQIKFQYEKEVGRLIYESFQSSLKSASWMTNSMAMPMPKQKSNDNSKSEFNTRFMADSDLSSNPNLYNSRHKPLSESEHAVKKSYFNSSSDSYYASVSEDKNSLKANNKDSFSLIKSLTNDQVSNNDSYANQSKDINNNFIGSSEYLTKKELKSVLHSEMENDQIKKRSLNYIHSDDKNYLTDHPITTHIANNNFDNLETNNKKDKNHVIDLAAMNYLGVLFRVYLLFEDKANKLFYVIDQHAFHERILFENLMKNSKLLLARYKLLKPKKLVLSESYINNLRLVKNKLYDLGFELEFFDQLNKANEVSIVAIPALLSDKDFKYTKDVLEGLCELDYFHNSLEVNSSWIMEDVLSSIACHSAIKAGHLFDQNQINRLIAQSKEVNFFHNCPHGRRVIHIISSKEVKKWFDRT